MQRNSFLFEGFRLDPVLDFSVFTGLSVFAGDSDIDDFLLHDAERHFAHKMAVTYALSLPPEPTIIAFASLQNDAIKLGGSYDGFPYRSLPAVKIGRLGVRQAYQRMGVGSFLLGMLARFMLTANRTGCRFITLDAYNTPKTLAFYEKNGFEKIKSGPINPKKHTVPMFRDITD